MTVPVDRIHVLNDAPRRDRGAHVVYWMVANRRTQHNFALQRAVWLAREHSVPLVVLEPLRCDYPWASDRIHAAIVQGMADNRAALADKPVLHHAYVEPEKGAGKGLLAAWAERAVAVVTDLWPAFFMPRMQAAAAAALSSTCRLEAVDSVGILPLSASPKGYVRAHDFRRFFQKVARPHLGRFPLADPLDGVVLPKIDESGPARDILERWPQASDALLQGTAAALAELPIDHSVPPVDMPGGATEARRRWRHFLGERLERYGDDRNQPDRQGSSGLSPWLHFGHISAHELVADVLEVAGWTPELLGDKARGKRSGWWGLDEAVEGFLDELVTWREVGHHFMFHHPDAERYETLPDWARTTMEAHAADERPHLYDLATLEAARTHDDIWNAAQTELVRTGKMHNYLRMLWGKKILEWTEHPRQALEWMLHLNNKYALDGRDPNSMSGITWVLGRFDRAWGPERQIFGKIRYMSSESTRRKLRIKPYLARFGPAPSLFD